MMGWNYQYMMGQGWSTFGVLGIFFWIVIFVDAILLGLWLWQQLQKGKK